MEEELKINSSGDETKDLELIYKELAGLKSLDEIPEDLRGNKQALADAIGVLQTSTGQIEKMEDFQERLNGLDKQSAKEIAGLMSGDSSQFTIKEQLDGGMDITNDYLQNKASQLGYIDENGNGDISQMAEGLNYKDTTVSELDKDLQEQWRKENEAAYQDYLSKHEKDKDANGNVLTPEQIKADFITSMGQTTVSAADFMKFDFTQTQQEIEEEAQKIKDQLKANGITGDNLDSATSYDNKTGKRLVEQTSKMGAEEGNNYIAAFNEAVQGSKDKTAMANYLSSIDPTNMTEVVKAMDYMQSQGADSSKIQEFWDAITNGAGTYISSLNEILQLTERMQQKMASVTDVSKRMEEGTGTYEDVMALVEAGADISKFQLTPEGWKATGEDIEEATQKIKRI